MKFNHIFKSLATSAVLMSVFGMPVFADHHEKAIMEAVKNTDRPEGDVLRDGGRRPADILAFAGVAPGMTILDINAGSGYYSEILSHVVGPEGKVYSHNGAVYWTFLRKTEPKRYADGRLANVTHIHDGNETINLPENSLDLAMAVLSYHDYYYTDKARIGGGHEDVPAVLGSIYKALKPGGAFVIVDHVAKTGTGPKDFDTLHRIDPAFVKKQMADAGFKFSAESAVLLNSDDSKELSAFASEISGKTSRFVFKFIK